MKLYINTTSERATKGQGGNRFVKATLLIGNKDNPKHIATLLANVVEDEVILQFWADKDGKGLGECIDRIIYPLEKGKKQKGEKICSVIGCLNKSKYHYQFEDLCELHNKQ